MFLLSTKISPIKDGLELFLVLYFSIISNCKFLWRADRLLCCTEYLMNFWSKTLSGPEYQKFIKYSVSLYTILKAHSWILIIRLRLQQVIFQIEILIFLGRHYLVSFYHYFPPIIKRWHFSSSNFMKFSENYSDNEGAYFSNFESTVLRLLSPIKDVTRWNILLIQIMKRRGPNINPRGAQRHFYFWVTPGAACSIYRPSPAASSQEDSYT